MTVIGDHGSSHWQSFQVAHELRIRSQQRIAKCSPVDSRRKVSRRLCPESLGILGYRAASSGRFRRPARFRGILWRIRDSRSPSRIPHPGVFGHGRRPQTWIPYRGPFFGLRRLPVTGDRPNLATPRWSVSRRSLNETTLTNARRPVWPDDRCTAGRSPTDRTFGVKRLGRRSITIRTGYQVCSRVSPGKERSRC